MHEFDEIPIKTSKAKTFEELLEEQLKKQENAF